MSPKNQVAILGAGPSGAVTALCLARLGHSVALFEGTRYDAGRFGETLPPEINPIIRRLGLRDSFLALSPIPSPGILSAWGRDTPSETDFLRNPHGCGWHIDRNSFDRMLATEAANAGALLYTNHRITDPAGIQADFIVDATGRNGLRIEGTAHRETGDTLLAIALRIALPQSPLPDLRTCIQSTPEGWWYTSPLPGNQAMAMFFTDPALYADPGISIEAQLEAAPLIASRIGQGRILNSTVLHAASSLRTTIHGSKWLAVGDSASSYDPLSGQGIFKALRQGSKAAETIRAYLAGDSHALETYTARVRSEFRSYATQRESHYREERRWADQPFWQSRR